MINMIFTIFSTFHYVFFACCHWSFIYGHSALIAMLHEKCCMPLALPCGIFLTSQDSPVFPIARIYSINKALKLMVYLVSACTLIGDSTSECYNCASYAIINSHLWHYCMSWSATLSSANFGGNHQVDFMSLSLWLYSQFWLEFVSANTAYPPCVCVICISLQLYSNLSSITEHGSRVLRVYSCGTFFAQDKGYSRLPHIKWFVEIITTADLNCVDAHFMIVLCCCQALSKEAKLRDLVRSTHDCSIVCNLSTQYSFGVLVQYWYQYQSLHVVKTAQPEQPLLSSFCISKQSQDVWKYRLCAVVGRTSNGFTLTMMHSTMWNMEYCQLRRLQPAAIQVQSQRSR